MKAETKIAILTPTLQSLLFTILYAEGGQVVQDPCKRYRRTKNTIKKAQMAILVLKSATKLMLDQTYPPGLFLN